MSTLLIATLLVATFSLAVTLDRRELRQAALRTEQRRLARAMTQVTAEPWRCQP